MEQKQTNQNLHSTYSSKKDGSLRVGFLGGLGEVGRNMMFLDWEGKILLVDMGLRFPEEDMPGIDFLIPNVKSLQERKKDIVGTVFTHGHYDHIGAVPYLADKLGNPPLYASGLTRGIIMKRQEEFPKKPRLICEEVKEGSKVKLPPFEVEFFHQNHNIMDNMGLRIKTPMGYVVHTSDFKFDSHPVNDTPTDFARLKRMGEEGVLLLMSDSTGAEEEGHSLSEQEIFKNMEELFKNAKGRVVAATFASLINRIQQVITLSEKYGRKVAVDGHTMKANVEICKQLGYIKAKKGTLITPKEMDDHPDSKVTLICTGAQGEEQAVLMKIANREHRFLQFKKNDTVIFSSSVIPGNERTVQIVKDEILRQGATVYHYKMMDIHAGGHGQQEELKEMIKLMKPKYFVPIHGQYSMLKAHSQLAQEMGVKQENIAVAENGEIVTCSPSKISLEKGKLPTNLVMVDGLGIGDVGEVVLRDRQTLSTDGMFVIVAIVDRQTGKVRGSPDIISRGFVYLKESQDLLVQTRKKVVGIVNKSAGSGGAVNWAYVKDELRNQIGDFFYEKTKRRPMILPVVIEV